MPRDLAINETGDQLNCRGLDERPINYVEVVVSAGFKENPKQFWSFIKSKRQEASCVSELVNRDAFLQSNTTAKAEF